MGIRAENVARADRVMRSLTERNNSITKTKLRSMFALLTDLFNELSISREERLSGEQINQLLAAKVRIVYEIGREERKDQIRSFIDETELLSELDAVMAAATRGSFIEFYHYFEALVAYQRYYETMLGKKGN